MSDTVKRETVIATINTMYECCDTGDITDYRDLMLGAVETLPSADRPTWIPCSERLPNENEWVLCSCNNGFAILILKLKGKVWHKTEYIEYLPEFVNAWMPLPEPWKGADDD